MNERPDQNRGAGAPPQQWEGRATGSFKVSIDQQELAAGSVDMGRRRGQAQGAYAEPPASMRAHLSEEERKKEKKAHKKRNRIKARKNKRIFSFMWLCMVLLVSFTLASYLIGGSNDFFAVGRPEGTTQVDIPENVTLEQLSEILSSSGAIGKPEFFTLYCTVKKEEMEFFQPGSYTVETNLDYEDLINTLQGGNEDLGEEITVTIPEGRNALEIAQLMEENGVCKAQEFLDALNTLDFSNYTVIAGMGGGEGRYFKIEGYLFPDTYNFYQGENLESVIGKLINNFQSKISDQIYAMAEQRGMSLDQVVTMASIIQAEAADVGDMFNVSAVLHNRMDFGSQYDIYRLECDSTMFYPYRNAQAVPQAGALPYGDYDTYKVDGLPKGPICNPGAEAILAAVRPNGDEAGSYLYFCHAEDGTAYYASDSWQHQENLVAAGLVDSADGGGDGYYEDDYNDEW